MVPSNAHTRYKIAIVEDEPSIRNLYLTKLELSGFDVRTANDGVEGLQLLEDFAPDLALVDIYMPQMNGDEMLVKVREHEWGANIRVVILTNISRDEAPSILRFLRVDRYVIKAHYTPAQVDQIVREILHIP
jgi:two-component system OmpR family response regulator